MNENATKANKARDGLDVIGAHIVWDEQGIPLLEIFVEELPDEKEIIYTLTRNDGGVFLHAESEDGFVHFLLHNPDDESGPSSGVARVKGDDGKEYEYEYAGAWSSRAGISNARGFQPCVEVELRIEDGAHRRGYVTVCVANEALKEYCLGSFLTESQSKWNDDELIYTLRHEEDEFPIQEPVAFEPSDDYGWE